MNTKIFYDNVLTDEGRKTFDSSLGFRTFVRINSFAERIYQAAIVIAIIKVVFIAIIIFE
jgi:hypothetical protein